MFWRPQFLFTWMGGKKQQTLSGVYGTQGTGSTANSPGVRQGAATWLDSSGSFWLFGGFGYDSFGDQGQMNDLWEYTSSNGKWTWVSGTNSASGAGVYGTKGTGSTSNYPGGRYYSASWIDSSGNLWLFGGGGYDTNSNFGALNDLWEYTPSSSKWTWVSGANTGNPSAHYGTKGTGSTSNFPGGRMQAIGWNDGAGNFWIFGGWGYDSGTTQSVNNDLWKYTVASGKWTWVSGANAINASGTYGVKGTGATTNTPGARDQSAAWMDSSGNFWLFGGFGFDSAGSENDLNDLWEFTPSSSKWTWVAGANVVNASGTYGTQGTGSTSNIPGARSSQGFAQDSSGNFWLFGGNGYDSAGNTGLLNDLWKFTPSSSQWAWVTGASTISQTGVYGTQGTGSTSNIPGARYGSALWLDSSANPWVFGGYAKDNSAVSGGVEMETNDLWKYTPSNANWTWMSGSSGNLQQGYYGTQGTPSASNLPSANSGAQTWVDSSGNLWLFGGAGMDSLDDPVWMYQNALWKYSPSTSQWTWVAGSTVSGQSGIYGTKGTGSTGNLPGGRTSGLSWTDSSGNFWLFGGDGYDSSGNIHDMNDLWKYNPANGQWTWVSGSSVGDQVPVYGTLGTGSTSNIPGARNDSVSWIDVSGNLWLFGGAGLDSASNFGDVNDLWKFNPSTLQWTWVSGSNLCNQNGVYGTLGTGSTSNIPGARNNSVSWIDASGNLWLFGGYGNDSVGNGGALNDLWKFAPSTSKWTWVGGANTVNATGVYGTQGVASSSNVPGARYDSVSWSDSAGNFWLMGGVIVDSTGTGGGWGNDVWRYSPSTNQWTWVLGSNLGNPSGVYNTVGVNSLSSVPGGRNSPLLWHDQRGVTWFFGGNSIDAFGNAGMLNDLWKLSPL